MTAAQTGNGANPSLPAQCLPPRRRGRGREPRRIEAFWMPACGAV